MVEAPLMLLRLSVVIIVAWVAWSLIVCEDPMTMRMGLY